MSEELLESTRKYFRVMLGPKSIFADVCFAEGWMGVDFLADRDLTNDLVDDWRIFNKSMIPVYLDHHPQKSKIAAGLACGMLHSVCRGIPVGSCIMSPDGNGNYRFGEVIGEYKYVPDQPLPHQRSVKWFPILIARSDLSEGLRNSTGSIGTVSTITKHATEIENLIAGNISQTMITTNDSSIESPSEFAMEKHLEDFLAKNWQSTELGAKYDILEDDGELIGQQFQSDTGPIDILAISKDRSELLVVELKKGRASDAVVGQIQRYMGYILDEVADEHQNVRGCIIAFEDDLRIRRALRINPLIDFYLYEITFKLTSVVSNKIISKNI